MVTFAKGCILFKIWKRWIWCISARRWVLKNFVPEWCWPVEVVLDHVRIQVRNRPFSFGVKRILVNGSYEECERRMVVKACREKDHVIEMGTSIGIVSSIISNLIGDEGKLVTIEADKALVGVARETLCANSNAVVIHGFGLPLWSTEGLQVSRFDNNLGSLGGRAVIEHRTAVESDSRIWSLHRICEQHDIDPTVLVCDIEGSESVLLEHEFDPPKSLKHIIIEIHPSLLPEGENSVENICANIQRAGYKLKERDDINFWFTRGN